MRLAPLLLLGLFATLVAPSVLSWHLYFAPAIWMVTSALGALSFLYFCAFSKKSFYAAVTTSSIAFLLFFANALLAVSFFQQGYGFNYQFFEHLTFESLKVAVAGFREEIALFIAAALLVVTLPLSLAQRFKFSSQNRRHPALALVLALLLCYPLWDLLRFVQAKDGVQNYQKSQSVEMGKANLSAPLKTKNIILIYAEQLEQLYFDSDAFPERPLMQLAETYKDSIRFTNVRQVPGTGWTTAGMIASQCGFGVTGGIHFGGNSRLSSVAAPFPDAVCIADYLRLKGYRSVFIGGAPLAFGGKGNFLRTHGFDSVMGRSELEAKVSDSKNFSSWGVHDDQLFEIAKKEIAELEAGDQPYLFSMLTLGTHHPNGELSPSCGPYDSDINPMIAALNCTDSLLSQLLTDLRAITQGGNTLIAVFSDHLALRNSLSDRLLERADDRRLLFFLPSDIPAGVTEEMSHFDVGPTLLAAAGFSPNTTIGFGKSYFPMVRETPSSKEALKFSAPNLITANVLKDGVLVNVTDMQVSVGDTNLAITAPFSDDNAGYDTSGLFMLVAEDSGDLFDVIFTREPEKIAKALDKKVVLALAKPAAAAPWQLYVGRLSETSIFKGRTFVVKDKLALSGEQLSDLISRSDFPASAPDIQSASTSFIAHAGGALQNNTYTNSLEALESNKAHFDLFEVDLIFTSDNELTCLHDWDKTFKSLFGREVTSPLTLGEFRAAVAGLEITPCDLSSLMDWLSNNPSKYIVTDIKGRNIEALEQIAGRYPELMDQIIPQVYQWGEYAQATALGYDKIILTLYMLPSLSVPRLLQDVFENEYFAVTFPKSMADDLGELLASRGVRTYVHTVNKMQEAKALQEKGVWGVYTDFLHD